MKTTLLTVVICISLFTSSCANSVKGDWIIWKGQPYAAFTSLVFYEGYFYCAFREANSHADLLGNDCGVIRIIRSKKGKSWMLYYSISIEGNDLRDPQLCITPDNRLMLTAEDVVYLENKAVKRNTLVAFKEEKNLFSDIQEVVFTPALSRNWLWKPENVQGNICGFLYIPFFAFTTSDDGTLFHVYQKITELSNPTESSVSFFNEQYYAMVRTSDNAELGVSKDGSSWKWYALDEKIACPQLFVYKGRLFCAGRSYKETTKTTIFEIDPIQMKAKAILHISTGKDCAYPGIVIHRGRVYASYYLGDGKQSDIHFCEISL